uniref:Uncharacterized protein n=1 Tax=Schizaphis graminum TaxID=13262 RepID=A0A2S2NFZ9_SCHGA
MGPSEACRFHEKEILKNKSPLKLLANGSINPIKNSVYHLHNVWRKSNFGSVDHPLEKLKEKIPLYNLQGNSVYVNEDTPWVVLVTTKIMKRAQLLDASREIIFCDSSSSCDTLETTITILLTATKAGAVPLSI